jgi:outer membrane biosynthesis protein TonB
VQHASSRKLVVCSAVFLAPLLTSALATPIAAAEQASAAPAPVKLSQDEADKLIVLRPNNALMARGQRLNGSLTIAYTVDKFGNTTDIVVIGGVDKSGIMTRLGTDEVSKWKYRPYQLNGQPTPFRTAITLNFPNI